jgi:predicted phosphodiesterase
MSQHWTDNKLKQMLVSLSNLGEKQTLEIFNISQETLNRYKREIKTRNIKVDNKSGVLSKIADLYSDKELETIAKGGRLVPGMKKVPVVDFDGERIRIGAMSDTHLGSKYTHPEFIHQAFEEFRKEGVDMVVHVGDVTEGMSKRDGHVYELSHIGYHQQKAHAIEVLGEWTETPAYAIDGNHDRWYMQNSDTGAIIVSDICDALPNWTFLGHDEGDISLGGVATLKLWHGLDGSSYALSYRLQKIIESLSGGEKPSVLLCGHVHKYVHIFERMVHAVSVGCMQRQSQWMRGKRLAAHVGFCIMDVYINKSGVCKFANTFYPFYT